MSDLEKFGPQRHQPPQRLYDPQQLKILIVSTPKTGNTMLKHMLSAIYDLPIVYLAMPFDPQAANQLVRHWVAHQHFLPHAGLLRWAEQNNVVLITTVRHPGDVLVSLHHHMQNIEETASQKYGLEAKLIGTDDQKLVHFVRDFFFTVIDTSIFWIYTQKAQVVRYEDLRRDAAATLARVTERIAPVSAERIERAVDKCDIKSMRKLSGLSPKFFRKGGQGDWRDSLPAEAIDLLASLEPYPAQFAALGYTLDPVARSDEAARPRAANSPWYNAQQFDNGAPLPLVCRQLYLSIDSAEARRRWPQAADSGPGSFYAWLNAPYDHDRSPGAAPQLTNLAAYLSFLRHRPGYALTDWDGRALLVPPARATWATQRQALKESLIQISRGRAIPANLRRAAANLRPARAPQARLPAMDESVEARAAAALWFLNDAQATYDLPAAFVEPMRQNFLEWALLPAADDPARADAMPIPNVVAYLYRQRPDVQSAYPDIYGRHRIEIFSWFLLNAMGEHGLHVAVLDRIREDFTAWANMLDPHDPGQRDTVICLTKLAAYVYRHGPALQQQFPDVYGQDRVPYLVWLMLNNAHLGGALRAISAAWAARCEQLSSGALVHS